MRVLVLCAANQCRSRVAEAVLRDALRDLPQITVVSAGSLAAAPMPICADAERFLITQNLPRDPQQRSQAMAREVLEAADIIFAVDAQVRAAVTALDPGSRERTFLLRSASRSAQFLLNNERVALARDATRSGIPHIEEEIDGMAQIVVSALHKGDEANWLHTELAAAHAFAEPGEHEIPDAHESVRLQHRGTFEAVQSSCAPIAQLIHQVFRTTA